MMRVVGRMFVVAAIASVAVATVANTDPVRVCAPIASFIDEGQDASVGTRAAYSTGFEASEGYSLGTCSNNNGWLSFGRNNATPVPGPRNPTGVVPAGGNPGQALRLDHNANFPPATNIGCLSPQFGLPFPSLPVINVDVYMDDYLGADYLISPQNSVVGLVTAQVDFSYNGFIYVADDPDGIGVGAPANFFQAGTWDPQVWTTLQFEFNAANGTINYYIGPDKEHLSLLYAGKVWTNAGTNYTEMAVFSDNYQGPDTSFDGGPGFAMLDNIQIKPEPATLALLGIGTLLLARRRR